MPASPSLAQSEASRLNGARSAGPVTAAGKARSALNGVRHGLSGRTFFLLPDEDPAEFPTHEATWLAAWRPRDLAEHDAALVAVRALWREIRADRLEAAGAGRPVRAPAGSRTQAEREAARAAAMSRWPRCCATAPGSSASSPPPCASLRALRQRRLVRSPPRDEPEPPPAAEIQLVPDEPERLLNRHQRRALAAIARKRAA